MQGIFYWIDKRAQITPNRTALIGERNRMTYEKMADAIKGISHQLSHSYGVKMGDRVAILSGNSIDYLLLLFAIAKIGAIAVPLNIRLTKNEWSYQIKDSQTTTLIMTKDFKEISEELQDDKLINLLISLEDLVGNANTKPFDSKSHLTKVDKGDVDSSFPFLIIYTSGTTGRPKGAVLTQENMYWNSIHNILAIDIRAEDKVLTILPLFHIGGIGLFALPALLAGGTVLVPDRFDPAQTLDWIEKEKITIVMGVPTIFDAIRKSNRFSLTDFSSIRWFYSGGAPCPHELIEYYLEKGIPFGQGFGMSETSPTVFMMSKEDYKQRIGSIGKPVMFTDVRIVNNQDQDVMNGEVGEMIFRGPNIFKEYWNLPEQTAASFKNGWFYSGDLAKQDNEGFYYIAGRKKEMIISGGENVYPLEVEQTIQELAEVAEVAVIGVKDEKWGEVPKAILSLKAGNQLTPEVIYHHCLGKLAKYKCPKTFEFIQELPKNATGKIDKAQLKRIYNPE